MTFGDAQWRKRDRRWGGWRSCTMASTSRNESDRDDSERDDSERDDDGRDDGRADGSRRGNSSSSGRRRRRRLPAVQVVRQGVEQLREITGRGPDTVSGIEPTE